jgi:XTP/dITP diphosphohydrolase
MDKRSTKQEKMEAFGRLLDIMDDLREKCPWDRKQTMSSLRNLTIEETYELADAIIENDLKEIEEEIGDLMLHMVFYAKIGEELDAFDIRSSLDAICNKLIKRHPHIYSDLTVKDAEEVKMNWERIKLAEGKKSVLSGVPNSLPAVVKAYRMQEKTAQVGFEWENKQQVFAKLQEEIDELHEAILKDESHKRREDEFGDVLFSLINYARFIDVDPETALERVNKKFKRRFEFIEKNAEKDLKHMSLEEMDSLWELAKTEE